MKVLKQKQLRGVIKETLIRPQTAKVHSARGGASYLAVFSQGTPDSSRSDSAWRPVILVKYQKRKKNKNKKQWLLSGCDSVKEEVEKSQ